MHLNLFNVFTFVILNKSHEIRNTMNAAKAMTMVTNSEILIET